MPAGIEDKAKPTTLEMIYSCVLLNSCYWNLDKSLHNTCEGVQD